VVSGDEVLDGLEGDVGGEQEELHGDQLRRALLGGMREKPLAGESR
jgi:hypothetical protein